MNLQPVIKKRLDKVLSKKMVGNRAKNKMCIQAWITPFTKQCFVTAGVSLNMMAHGLVMAYSAVLLTQLKTSQLIRIDDNSASWIASIIGISQIIGTLAAPFIIKKWGRKVTNLISAIIMTSAWFGTTICGDITAILAMRVLQGISMGLMAFLGSVLIGEYTTPRYRGPFLTTMCLAIVFGLFLSHTLGIFLSWQMTALICGLIGAVDVLLIFFAPESPSFLALQQRYDECREVFHWLRGEDEEEELEKMIETNVMSHEKESDLKNEKRNLQGKCCHVISVIKKKEFYKSVIVAVCMFMWNQWSGGIILDSYNRDIFNFILGNDINFAALSISLDVQRVISMSLAIVFYRHLKRRRILLIATILNLSALFGISLYVYGKTRGLPFDHVAIGVALIHLHMFSLAAGTLPLTNVLLGEITPLKYRETCGTIAIIVFSINLSINTKIAPYLFTTIGLHGAYFLYGTIVGLSFILPWIMLPETKDRTLQDIEQLFKGQSYYDEIDCKTLEPKSLLD